MYHQEINCKLKLWKLNNITLNLLISITDEHWFPCEYYKKNKISNEETGPVSVVIISGTQTSRPEYHFQLPLMFMNHIEMLRSLNIYKDTLFSFKHMSFSSLSSTSWLKNLFSSHKKTTMLRWWFGRQLHGMTLAL